MLLLALVTGVWLARSSGDPDTGRRPTTSTPQPTARGETDRATQPRGMPAPSELDAEVTRLRAAAPVTAAPSLPRIGGEAAHQPDLYAAEFVRRLLTRDYGQGRDGFLAWVQSEAARSPEPLVVGLIPPELHDRWAVFSLTDSSDGPAPIPDQTEWTRLGRVSGRATVTIRRVAVPQAWTNAVEAGRITDPGITARVVTADVVTTTVADGRTQVETRNVELGLEFEGPPTRATWGFVGAVTYESMVVGRR
jgi:hypothetical protein